MDTNMRVKFAGMARPALKSEAIFLGLTHNVGLIGYTKRIASDQSK